MLLGVIICTMVWIIILVQHLNNRAIMIFFKYIFYRIFSIFRKKHDEDESSYTAMVFVNLFMFMNIFEVGGILNNFNLLPVFFKSKIQVVIFIFVLLIINYFIFLHKMKYNEFCDEFERKTNSRSKQKGWIIILYFIISTSLLFVIPFIKP